MFPFLGLPQSIKPVMLNIHTAGNAVDCDVVCSRAWHRIYFLIIHSGANDTDLTLALYEATDVAKSSPLAVTKTCPIWYDPDAGASSETWIRATDAYSITIDPATQNPYVAIIEWDPAKHSEGYDCIYLSDTGGHANNLVTIVALGVPRKPQATPENMLS